MVLWHGWSCQEMCGTILWVGEQDDSTTLQSINSMHWWPSLQRGRIEICRRIFKIMLSNCSEMLKLGTYWTTWYSMVSELTCTIDHKMDQSLWQTIISFDLLHSSYMWVQKILSCGKHFKTMQIGTVSRLRFCRISWGFKIYIMWNIVRFRKSYFLFQSVWCINKLRFSTVQQNQKSIPWTQDWGWTVYPRLIFGIWSSPFFKETRIGVRKNGDIRLWTNVKFVQYFTQFKNENNLKEWSMIWTMLIFISSNVNSSRQEALSYIFEDHEAVIKTIFKGRSPTMKHVFRTHRVALDWLSDRINLDPKIQIKYIDTKNQLADILTQGNFTRDEWNHLLCLLNISHFSSTNCLEVMSKRTQEDAGEERVTAKSKPMMNLVSRYSASDENRIWKSERTSELVKCAANKYGDTYWALAHQTTQNGTLTKSGLLKSGNLVKCREQERRDPWMTSFVIDDDMNSDIATEWNLSLRSRSSLHRVNDRVRKILDQSSKDAMQDSNKHSLIWWMCMSSTLEASVFMGKNCSDRFTFHQKYREQSHFETDVWHIWKVDSRTIRGDFWSVSNQLGRFFMETIIFGQWWRSHLSIACKGLCIFLILCYVFEKWIKTQHQTLFGKKS